MGVTIEPNYKTIATHVHVLLFKGPTCLPCLLCFASIPLCFTLPCPVYFTLPLPHFILSCRTLPYLPYPWPCLPTTDQHWLRPTLQLLMDFGSWNLIMAFGISLSLFHIYSWLLQEPYYKRRPFGDMQMLCTVVNVVQCGAIYCFLLHITNN